MQLLEWKFDWRFMVRGLVLDKRRGCILKVTLFNFFGILFNDFLSEEFEANCILICGP